MSGKKIFKSKPFIVTAAAAVIFLLTGFLLHKNDIYFDIAKNIDLFTKVYKEIAFNYVDEVEPEEFMRSGIGGMLEKLDPYTIFIDEKRQEDIELITNGKYGGIGISIGVRDDKVTILEILDGYSAQRQGLRIGDAIIDVEGTEITEDNFEDISSLVKGEPGTFVELKVLRDSGFKDTLTFELLREEIVIKNVTYADYVEGYENTGYIKMNGFSRTAGDELATAIQELQKKGNLEALILDLRGNPGGLLDIAVDVSDKFLDKDKLIVTTRGRSDMSMNEFHSDQEPLLSKEKLILLVNERSASASEIVAGAVQDQDRGVIVGTKTFGKGLVQTIIPLSYNTSLKITTARYYTPSGRCIQKIDYAKDNKVIASYDSLINKTFTTSNKRKVYGQGGIMPDTVVPADNYDGIVSDLLAKGMFFKFASVYYNEHPDISYSDISDSDLYEKFADYIITEDYSYVSDYEKRVNSLLKDLEGMEAYADISNKLDDVKYDIRNLTRDDISFYKKEIVNELKVELASRYLGSNGRIIQQLKYDPQFDTALNILHNNSVYSRMLNTN